MGSPNADVTAISAPGQRHKNTRRESPRTVSRDLVGSHGSRCGQNPFAKLLGRLFGQRLVIAEATGCTSMRGEFAPNSACRVNPQDLSSGRGSAWSLDSGVLSCGMLLELLHQRRYLADMAEQALETTISSAIKKALEGWLNHLNDPVGSKIFGDQLIEMLPQYTYIRLLDKIHRRSCLYAKQSFWVIAGNDGACHITCGGIDHILAKGEDINVIVLETEVDSLAGSQSSPVAPSRAMATACDHVYVANVFMGASETQWVKTFKAAEAYDGPALITASGYPAGHGIKLVGGKALKAVKSSNVVSGVPSATKLNV